jgi:transcriptional regulator with XRE-family HTH domain
MPKPISPWLAAVGDRIRNERRGAHMTAEDLAERVGVSWNAVTAWERGERQMNISTLMRVADALNVTPEELLG